MFLPLVTEERRWSDRKKSVELPLFSCYVFAKFTPNRVDRLRVLRVEGVFGLVGERVRELRFLKIRLRLCAVWCKHNCLGLHIPSSRLVNEYESEAAR